MTVLFVLFRVSETAVDLGRATQDVYMGVGGRATQETKSSSCRREGLTRDILVARPFGAAKLSKSPFLPICRTGSSDYLGFEPSINKQKAP
jgi:hypothetical protein